MSIYQTEERIAVIRNRLIVQSPLQRLFIGRALDMTLTTDQTLNKVARFHRANVTKVLVIRKTGAFGTACAGGIYTAVTKGGNALVAAAQSYANLTAANKIVDCTIAAVAGTDAVIDNPLYLSLTTGNTGALTADVYVYGVIID